MTYITWQGYGPINKAKYYLKCFNKVRRSDFKTENEMF